MFRLVEVGKLAAPLAMAQFAQSIMVFSDTVILGLIGIDALAGGSLGALIYQFFLLIFSGIFFAAANETAVLHGKRNFPAITRLLKAGSVLCIGFTALVWLLIEFIPMLLPHIGQTENNIETASEYLNAANWISLPAFAFMLLRCIASGLGITQPIMKIMLVCALMNVPISYVLGCGLYGFEGYGISGVAWATALMTYTMFFWLGFELLQHPTTRSILANWKRSHSTRQDYAIFWSLGVPIALAIIMEMGLFTSASLLAGTLGTLALAANQICLNIATVSFNIYIGIAQATAIKVGFNYGLSQSPEQGDPKAIESARRYGRAGLKLGLITASVSATLMFFFPELWVKLFTLNSTESRLDELMVLAASLLGVAALFQLADCSQVIAMHALRAFKLGTSPTLISIFGYWVIGFPAAWLLKDEFGLIGIWSGMGAGLLFTAITLTLLLERTATQKARSMMECST